MKDSMLIDILNKTNDRQRKTSTKINCQSCRIPFNQCKHHLRNHQTDLKNHNNGEIGDGRKKVSSNLQNLQFNCKFCRIGFHEKSKFIEHNSEAGHEKCSECKQILRNQTELKNHIDEIHLWFKCTTCSKSFSSKSKWEGKFSNLNIYFAKKNS